MCMCVWGGEEGGGVGESTDGSIYLSGTIVM